MNEELILVYIHLVWNAFKASSLCFLLTFLLFPSPSPSHLPPLRISLPFASLLQRDRGFAPVFIHLIPSPRVFNLHVHATQCVSHPALLLRRLPQSLPTQLLQSLSTQPPLSLPTRPPQSLPIRPPPFLPIRLPQLGTSSLRTSRSQMAPPTR